MLAGMAYAGHTPAVSSAYTGDVAALCQAEWDLQGRRQQLVLAGIGSQLHVYRLLQGDRVCCQVGREHCLSCYTCCGGWCAQQEVRG